MKEIGKTEIPKEIGKADLLLNDKGTGMILGPGDFKVSKPEQQLDPNKNNFKPFNPNKDYRFDPILPFKYYQPFEK
jgi:hypothetical protein